jgi:hypothetical protein
MISTGLETCDFTYWLTLEFEFLSMHLLFSGQSGLAGSNCCDETDTSVRINGTTILVYNFILDVYLSVVINWTLMDVGWRQEQ